MRLMLWEDLMNGLSVADELPWDVPGRIAVKPSVSGLRRTVNPGAAVLVTYSTVVGEAAVAVVIERPEVDREGVAWRCRVRLNRGTRREQFQIVGLSSESVLRQAVDLVAERLGISECELLGEATLGASAVAPAETRRSLASAGFR